MSEGSSDDSNARIFAILSIIFSVVPIVGLILGVLATQKGRQVKSEFAVVKGWSGITLSLIFACLFGYMGYKTAVQNNKEARYKQCIEERRSDFYSTEGVYWVAESQCDWARP